MHLVALSPVYVASLPWRRDARSWVLSVVCKMTFDLTPGEMRLSQQQDVINEQDQRWEDDSKRSVHAPSDVVPFKARADVTLVGNAFAPGGKRVRSLVARLTVGTIDKAIAVFGDRARGSADALPFTRMPLRYERAAGGAGSVNPVGGGRDRLPNLEPPNHHEGAVPPIGFGPIAPDWPDRARKTRRPWSAGESMPEDCDVDFFNVAPADQQLAHLRDDEEVVLENLHPDHARLATRLPGLHPQVFVERPNGSIDEVQAFADGLWIDTDRARCAVTWRAQLGVAHPEEPGRVLVAVAGGGKKLSIEDLRRLAQTMDPKREATKGRPLVPRAYVQDDDSEDGPEFQTVALKMPPRAPTGQSQAPRGAVPPLPPIPRASAPPPPMPPQASGPPPLPPPLPQPPALPREQPSPREQSQSRELPREPSREQPREPQRETPPPPPSQPTAPAMQAPESLPSGTYDLAESTNTDFFIASETTPLFDNAPAWLQPARERKARPAQSPEGGFRPQAPEPRAPAAPPAPTQAQQQQQPPPPPAPVPPSHKPLSTTPPPPTSMAQSTIAVPPAPVTGSILQLPTASSATPFVSQLAQPAAAPEPRSPWAGGAPISSSSSLLDAPMTTPAAQLPLTPMSAPVATPAPLPVRKPNEIVDLLWFDPESVPRIRARWPKIVDELDFEPLDPRHDLPVDDPAASRERHHAFGVLTRADTTETNGIGRAMLEAVDDGGRFTPPLVVLVGELRLPLDEVETLKATAGSAKPLAKDDKKLADLLDSINDLIGTPLLEGPGVVDGMLREIRDAVAQSKRTLPVKYLDQHVERVLLEQRKYQRRTVFGKPCVRALLGGSRDGGVPVYLPEDVSAKLPLVSQLKVRIIAEAHTSQDQYESHVHALKVVALGRIVSTEGMR
jgi:hypothetical protein